MSALDGSAESASYAAMPTVICPSGGLCNRLLHVAAAVRELVPTPRRVLLVCWVCRPACPEHFLKLFEPVASLRFIDQPEFARLTLAKSVIVRPTGAAISKSMLELARLDLFVPLLYIAEAIEAFGPVGSHTGLHIRRTDHIGTAAARGGVTSDADFAEVIASELRQDPCRRFFLATDNAETQRWVMSLCGDALSVWQEVGEPSDMPSDATASAGSSGSGSKPTGRAARRVNLRHTSMAHAVVDLFLLSHCRCIFGSNGSSFSDFARVLARQQPCAAGIGTAARADAVFTAGPEPCSVTGMLAKGGLCTFDASVRRERT